MDSKKYEKLMNYVINEDTEKAKELFHQIVVETSREIYESIMAEDEDEMGGKVGDLLDEINAEESGMMGDEDDYDTDFDDEYDMDDEDEDDDMDFEFGDIEDEELDSIEDNDEHEETLIRIEDKLDELIAEFDRINDEDEDDEDEDEDIDFDDEDEDEDIDFDDEDDEDDEDETDEVMEAVELQKVSVTHGDHGANRKSPFPANSGKKGMEADVVKFSGYSEPVPTGPKAPSNFYTKGNKELPGAGQFKNAPGHKKAELVPVAKLNKSPVAESRRTRSAFKRKI